jgi:hypothetical protein
MRRKWLGLSIFIVVFSALWAVLLAGDVVPQLRGDYGWRWPYALVREPARLLPLMIALAIYLVGVRWLLSRRAAWLLLWSVAAGVVLTLACLFVRSDPFFELSSVTLSGETGGWHYAAARITDVAAALRHWPSVMQRSTAFSSHMGISPPGMVLVYYAVTRWLENIPAMAQQLGEPLRALLCHDYRFLGYSSAQFASAWPGMLMPLWGALTVLPLYALGRRLFDERAARWSVVWWPLLPGFLMFAPLPNMFYPLPTVISVLWLVIGLQRGRLRWIVAAGALTSFLTFLTFTFMPLILLQLLLIGGLWLLRRQSRAVETGPDSTVRSLLRESVAFIGGLASIWVIVYLVSGAAFVEIFRAALGAHLNLDRPYLPWLVLHPNDFFVFTGWPMTFLAFAGIGLSIWHVWRSRRLTVTAVFNFALSLTLLALNFSGTLRGESGRILMFLAPFWLLVAGSVASAEQESQRPNIGWVATLTEAALLLMMVAVLSVGGSGLTPAPAAPPSLAEPMPEPAIGSQAAFEGGLRLSSFAGKVDRAQSALTLWLDWTADGQLAVPYYLSLIPVAPGGTAALEATLLQPFDQKYPVTCWRPENGHLTDRVVVPLFDAAQPGDWWVSLSLVNGATGEKLAVTLPDGTRDDQVGIGPFR